MALQHARQGQVIDVQPYGAAIRDAQSIALFKSDQIEVMRLVFPAGHHMPTHKVPGEIPSSAWKAGWTWTWPAG